MAIDASNLTSDITLELDEDDISIADFGKAYESFIGLIKEVTKEVAPERSATAWTVKVYPGSAGLGISGSNKVFSYEDISEILEAVTDGLSALANGNRPMYFTDRALECSRALGSLFKTKLSEPAIRIWSRTKQPLPVIRKIASNAQALLAPAYEEEGTVDGMLQKLDAHGKRQFIIYDVIDERAVKCEVNDALLIQAINLFQQRVEVIGTVNYRKDGMPVSIVAKKIVPFPKSSEVPSLEEIRALLARN